MAATLRYTEEDGDKVLILTVTKTSDQEFSDDNVVATATPNNPPGSPQDLGAPVDQNDNSENEREYRFDVGVAGGTYDFEAQGNVLDPVPYGATASGTVTD